MIDQKNLMREMITEFLFLRENGAEKVIHYEND